MGKAHENNYFKIKKEAMMFNKDLRYVFRS